MANDNPSPATRFAPGNRVNPGGRPKLIKEFQKFLKDEAYPEANKALMECLRSNNLKAKLGAVAIVYDRVFGKTPLPIVGSLGLSHGPRTDVMAALTDEELGVMESVAEKLMLADGVRQEAEEVEQ